MTREEATKRWHGKFANVNVGAMFNEVDTDGDGAHDRCPPRASLAPPYIWSIWPPPDASSLGRPRASFDSAARSGKITYDEWMAFWGNVVRYGYTSAEVEEEVDELLEGGAWVDFNDGRTTARGND